jgi:hypothetical protein
MKTSHWVGALAALVFVIFFVTFFLNFVGPTSTGDSSSGGNPEAADLPLLTFLVTSYPYVAQNGMPVGRYEQEHRKAGYQDYWFLNLNDVPIRLGAIAKTCKCQGVDVYVLPEGYNAQPPLAEPVPLFALPLGILGRNALLSFIETRAASHDLEEKADKFVALNPDDSKAEMEVPPRRAGWVRMKWTGEKAGPMNLMVKLWLHYPNSGIEVVLERKVNFVEPVQISGTERLGLLRPNDLPKGYFFYVWSSTRKSFNITKAEALRPKALSAAADAFVVGKPVPLTDQETDSVADAVNKARMLSCYRVPLTLEKLAPDGKTPFDLGNFRRQVEVLTDASEKPLTLTFNGMVTGDIQINGVDDTGGVAFGSFPKDSQPAPRVVYFRAESPDVKLELVKDRIPEFLDAVFTDESVASERSKAWKLEVRVQPGIYGTFPRDDDPAYRDSAIYLRTVGPSPQYIRIGVRGDAVDR